MNVEIEILCSCTAANLASNQTELCDKARLATSRNTRKQRAADTQNDRQTDIVQIVIAAQQETLLVSGDQIMPTPS